MRRLPACLALSSVLVSACNAGTGEEERVRASAPPSAAATASPAPTETGAAPAGRPRGLLPGMPAPLSQHDIYAADRPDRLAPAVRHDPALVYVPNSESDTLDVIDQRTFRIVGHYRVGRLPQHVTPSYDLRTLYVLNDEGNSVTVVNPRTGKPGRTIPVTDPYNMYFTPDGRQAIVVAEALQRLDFRDAHTFALNHSLAVDCAGVDHIDFAADGSYLIASCEFAGKLVKVDLRTEKVVGYMHVGGKPQDVKVDPAGKIFYVADMVQNGLHEIDGNTFTKEGFLPTGPETHGLYPSRDARFLYASNRGGAGANKGSVSVVDFSTRQVVATWSIPPPSTPDMGGVSPDGKVLWLAGRRMNEVYGLDTGD